METYYRLVNFGIPKFSKFEKLTLFIFSFGKAEVRWSTKSNRKKRIAWAWAHASYDWNLRHFAVCAQRSEPEPDRVRRLEACYVANRPKSILTREFSYWLDIMRIVCLKPTTLFCTEIGIFLRHNNIQRPEWTNQRRLLMMKTFPGKVRCIAVRYLLLTSQWSHGHIFCDVFDIRLYCHLSCFIASGETTTYKANALSELSDFTMSREWITSTTTYPGKSLVRWRNKSKIITR